MGDDGVLDELWHVICARSQNPSGGSYVSSILTDGKGVDRALEKVGEEAVEFILAAKNGVRERTVSEGADLLFHFLIALRASDIELADILNELAARRKR